MANHTVGGIFAKMYKTGADELLDLSNLGCEGFITAQCFDGGAGTLQASNDKVTFFGDQAISADSVDFAAPGPYHYLHVTVTAGKMGVQIQ